MITPTKGLLVLLPLFFNSFLSILFFRRRYRLQKNRMPANRPARKILM